MTPMAQKRVYTCWMLVEPAEDVPGLWVSHCLNFDVISQGHDPQSALESVREAVVMTVIDDLLNGRDPLERAAPEAEWDKLQRVLTNGTPTSFSQVRADQKLILARNETFVVEQVDHQQQVMPMQLATATTAYQSAA